MGAVITRSMLQPQPSAWNNNGIYYSAAYGAVSLNVSDTDPRNIVELQLEANVTAYSPTSSKNTEASAVVAVLNGDFQANAATEVSAVAQGSSRVIRKNIVVTQLQRMEDPYTISLLLSVQNLGGAIGSTSVNLTIPPYKQNATNSNRRITYTVDGVKYDLLNYK